MKYVAIYLRVDSDEEREKIKDAAWAARKSLNRYCLEAIWRQMENDARATKRILEKNSTDGRK